jgi:hypothetical protein
LQRRQIPRRKTHTRARTGANRAGGKGANYLGRPCWCRV